MTSSVYAGFLRWHARLRPVVAALPIALALLLAACSGGSSGSSGGRGY